jgi:hypothetical protein
MELSHQLTQLLIGLHTKGDLACRPSERQEAELWAAIREAHRRGFVRVEEDAQDTMWVILTPKGHDLTSQRLVGVQLVIEVDA